MRRFISALLAVLIQLSGGAVAFPVDALDVAVEIFYDSAWNDITSYVFDRPSSSISITRGRGNESSRCAPGRLRLELNNADGRFSARNHNSPLYGKIGRNTLIRVQVTYNAVTYTRFVGEVVSWPPKRDLSGNSRWVPLEAAGILRRLGRGSKPLKPPLQSTIQADDPHLYYRMEDGASSTRFASSVLGGAPVFPTVGVQYASIEGADGAGGSGPSFTDGGPVGLSIPVNLPGPFSIEYIVHPADDDDGDVLFSFSYTTVGSGTPTNIGITAPTYVDPTLEGSNGWHHVLITLEQNGADIQLRAWFDGGEVPTADHLGATLGNLVQIEIPGTFADLPLEPWGIAHVAVHASASVVDAAARYEAMRGYASDTTTERMARLAAQGGFTFSAPYEGGALLGPQRRVTRLQAMQDAESTDQGFMFELRDQLGLTHRTNASRYNQVPVILDYEAGHISPPFEPAPDDLGVFNDREVGRYNGSLPARAVLEEGPLSIQDPPDGIGLSDDGITVNAYTDDQTEDIAWWRLHVGTWDAERYPRVHVNLRRNTSLIASVAPLDSGDLLEVTNLPDGLPDAPLLVEGYTETIRQFAWDITFNTSPAGPYQVVGRWALLSHELRANINSAVTSIDIVNTDTAGQPMLATEAADIGTGYSITIGAEEMQLTAVASPSSPTFVTAAASHADNASVAPAVPSVQDGDVLILLACIRNSGTGVPNTPTEDYVRLDVFPANSNIQLFGKISDGTESSPTVSFTGGVAGATCSARIVRFRNLKAADINQLVISSASCLNTSAQNITYPGLSKPVADNSLILVIGWKQDDNTGVATLSGASEVFDESTTTGDDQSFVLDRIIQTTAAHIPSGAFTVSGGAAAISRGAVVAIHDDYQTATVTRGIGGTTAASHTAGDAVTMTEPMRWGLL